jgi:hypothetical protein
MQRSSRLDTAVSGRIDYAKTIQPIWDRHCVSCHSLEKYEGKLDLSGAPAASFMPASYSYLRQRGMLPGKNNIITRGDDKPYAPIGSATGKLDPFLSAEHHGVRLSDLELRTIRHWMDCGALNAATYGAWGHVRSGPECTLFDMARQGLGICMNCHGNAKGGKNSDTHLAVKAPLFNLAKPEKSLLVLAPLMAEQGGLGLCRATDGKAAVVFAKGKDDPLYKAALGQCAKRAAKQDWHAAANYRLDKAYVVQMKRFGILPADFDETAPPPDPYDLDRQYYESHWKPLAAEPEATSSGETLSNNTRATR